MSSTIGDPHEAAMQILRTSPARMTEPERYARLCMALACDFPELPVDRVLSVATTAMTCWKGCH